MSEKYKKIDSFQCFEIYSNGKNNYVYETNNKKKILEYNYNDGDEIGFYDTNFFSLHNTLYGQHKIFDMNGLGIIINNNDDIHNISKSHKNGVLEVIFNSATNYYSFYDITLFSKKCKTVEPIIILDSDKFSEPIQYDFNKDMFYTFPINAVDDEDIIYFNDYSNNFYLKKFHKMEYDVFMGEMKVNPLLKNFISRVVSKDGINYVCTRDFRTDRLNLKIINNKIVDIYLG